MSTRTIVPIAHDRLLYLLNYDTTTGVFRWTGNGTRHRHRQGDIAGCVHRKNNETYARWQIVVDGRHYKAHRLAWFYVHGEWPNMMIDHINGDPCDNRICNLRLATRAENSYNLRCAKGKTGLRGVSYLANGYMAQISHNNRSVYLGRFKTAEEAHAAWREAAMRLRGNRVVLD